MAEPVNLHLALELNTLYEPALFGLGTFEELFDPDKLKPARFFETAMAVAAAQGLEGIELTFGPGSYENAVRCFGSGCGLSSAAKAYGLEICGGFYSGLMSVKPCRPELNSLWLEKRRQKEILEEVRRYACFLSEAGADFMPAALPVKTAKSSGSMPCLLDLLFEMQDAALYSGVQLLAHHESNTLLWNEADTKQLLNKDSGFELCPDIGHIWASGASPADFILNWGNRIKMMHVKDCIRSIPKDLALDEALFKNHNDYFAVIGEGRIDWAGIKRAIQAAGFEGRIVLELPAEGQPIGLHKSINYLKEEI